jgi:hypothetical protein
MPGGMCVSGLAVLPCPHPCPLAGHASYRIDNYTSVDLNDLRLGHSLLLAAFFVSHGDTVSAPDSVTLHFSSSSDEWKYLDYHSLRLLLDDSIHLDLGQPEHVGTVGSGYVLEQFFVRISRSQLLNLAIANKVEGALGPTNFQLNHDESNALRDFALRMAGRRTTPRDKVE